MREGKKKERKLKLIKGIIFLYIVLKDRKQGFKRQINNSVTNQTQIFEVTKLLYSSKCPSVRQSETVPPPKKKKN